MTVEELITILNKVEDKTRIMLLEDDGMYVSVDYVKTDLYDDNAIILSTNWYKQVDEILLS